MEQLQQLLGSNWVVVEEEKVGGYKQFICKKDDCTYLSPWYKEATLGNLVYIARMCHQLVKEEEIKV